MPTTMQRTVRRLRRQNQCLMVQRQGIRIVSESPLGLSHIMKHLPLSRLVLEGSVNLQSRAPRNDYIAVTSLIKGHSGLPQKNVGLDLGKMFVVVP